MNQPPDKTPERIAGMFDAIAPRYDLLNHVLSAGMDRGWRNRAVDALAQYASDWTMGRGEAWGGESGTDRLIVIRD